MKPATKELILDEKWTPRALTGQGWNQCPGSVVSPEDDEGEASAGESIFQRN